MNLHPFSISVWQALVEVFVWLRLWPFFVPWCGYGRLQCRNSLLIFFRINIYSYSIQKKQNFLFSREFFFYICSLLMLPLYKAWKIRNFADIFKKYPHIVLIFVNEDMKMMCDGWVWKRIFRNEKKFIWIENYIHFVLIKCCKPKKHIDFKQKKKKQTKFYKH